MNVGVQNNVIRFGAYYNFSIPPEISSQFKNTRYNLGDVSGDFSGSLQLEKGGKLIVCTDYTNETVNKEDESLDQVRTKTHKLLRHLSGLATMEELTQQIQLDFITPIQQRIEGYTGRIGAMDYERERIRIWEQMRSVSLEKVTQLFEAAKNAVDAQIDAMKENQ